MGDLSLNELFDKILAQQLRRGVDYSAMTYNKRIANALVKTIKTQETAYAKAVAKCKQVNKDLEDEPNDAELLEIKEEADANEVLLRLKLERKRQCRTAMLHGPL